MPKAIQPVRLSVFQAGSELKVNHNKLKVGLKANGIAPGPDGKYSLREIFAASHSPSGLETRAREAKLNKIIDEAAVAKLRRRREENRLIEMEAVVKWINDVQVTLVSRIRHSRLSEDERQLLIDELVGKPPVGWYRPRNRQKPKKA